MKKLKIFIYLDDLRELNDTVVPSGAVVVICRTYESATRAIKQFYSPIDTEIICDLDHDLGQEKTGYDFCKFLLEEDITGKFHIHSMNPVGVANMRQLLSHYGWKEF